MLHYEMMLMLEEKRKERFCLVEEGHFLIIELLAGRCSI
jgi:hypothetical protein